MLAFIFYELFLLMELKIDSVCREILLVISTIDSCMRKHLQTTCKTENMANSALLFSVDNVKYHE